MPPEPPVAKAEALTLPGSRKYLPRRLSLIRPPRQSHCQKLLPRQPRRRPPQSPWTMRSQAPDPADIAMLLALALPPAPPLPPRPTLAPLLASLPAPAVAVAVDVAPPPVDVAAPLAVASPPAPPSPPWLRPSRPPPTPPVAKAETVTLPAELPIAKAVPDPPAPPLPKSGWSFAPPAPPTALARRCHILRAIRRRVAACFRCAARAPAVDAVFDGAPIASRRHLPRLRCWRLDRRPCSPRRSLRSRRSSAAIAQTSE